jgi:hypothetical protein
MFIPGMMGLNYIPWCDPPIEMTLGTPEGRLLTTDGGNKFEIEGDIKLAAKAVLDYVMVWTKPLGDSYCKFSGIGFSRFDFDFKNEMKLTVKEHWKEDEQTMLFITEVRYWVTRYNNLRVFW